MVQLARRVPGLPPPERQFEVRDRHGELLGRVDLAWPGLGMFVELDGQQFPAEPLSPIVRSLSQRGGLVPAVKEGGAQVFASLAG